MSYREGRLARLAWESGIRPHGGSGEHDLRFHPCAGSSGILVRGTSSAASCV